MALRAEFWSGFAEFVDDWLASGPNAALKCASVVDGGSGCRFAAAFRLASSFSFNRVCTSSGESPPTTGLTCSPATEAVPGRGLVAFVELDENQSPTAATEITVRKIHDCIRFGITPVAVVRLFATGAAAVESSVISGFGCGVVDIKLLSLFLKGRFVLANREIAFIHNVVDHVHAFFKRVIGKRWLPIFDFVKGRFLAGI